jgi:hypothetical protein
MDKSTDSPLLMSSKDPTNANNATELTDSQLLSETQQTEATNQEMSQPDEGASSHISNTGLTQEIIDLTTCEESESGSMTWDYYDIKPSVLNTDELNSIRKQITYHRKHLYYYGKLTEKLTHDGLEEAQRFEKEQLKKLPKKPPQFRLKKRNSQTKASKGFLHLTGHELLEKLKEFIIEGVDVSSTIQQFYNELDVQKVMEIVKTSDKLFKYKQSCVLKDAVLYGLWLEHLYKLHAGGFKNFIKNNLSCSVTWVNKTREMAYIFSSYAKLQTLSINITTALTITPKLKTALLCDSEQAMFWQQRPK